MMIVIVMMRIADRVGEVGSLRFVVGDGGLQQFGDDLGLLGKLSRSIRALRVGLC